MWLQQSGNHGSSQENSPEEGPGESIDDSGESGCSRELGREVGLLAKMQRNSVLGKKDGIGRTPDSDL